MKEKLLENWVLKIMAFFLAWILWLFIFLQGETGTVSRVDAPVEIQGLSDQMEISSELPRTVQVTMRGTRQDLKCIINLQNYKEGKNLIDLTKDNIKPTRALAVEVLQVIPSQVTLMLEKTVSKEVAISVPVEGDPAEGFDVYEKILDPAKTTITGPRSLIEPRDEVSTEVIDIKDRRQSANFRVRLNLGDGKIRSSLSAPVEVEIRIGPHRQDYTVKDVPVSFGNVSYDVTPKKIDIRLLAPESLKTALVPGNFRTTIASRDLEGTNFPVKVKPVITFDASWIDIIKIIGTAPSEVTIDKIDLPSPPK